MTQIDQIIADALAGSPETHVAILAREVVRLREAPAVVVPELVRDCQGMPTEVAAIGDEYKFLVELESELQCWREFGDVNSANFAQDLVTQRKADCSKRLRAALRASQGGADHG